MANYRTNLPQIEEIIFVCYTGVDTDLIFNRGIDLPGFASYALLETYEGKEILRGYYTDLVDLARQKNVGVILDSITWAANRDRGEAIGYNTDDLKEFNLAAVDMISSVRQENGDLPTVLSAQVGPRADGYFPADLMTTDEAEEYHSEQIKIYSKTEADLISAFTLGYVGEAIGIIRSAKSFNIPVAIAFTIETDGCLPTGMPLKEAIKIVDNATDSGAAYFLINCSHPDHFINILTDEPWMKRLRGVVVNASRCSHTELNEADILDSGNPNELGLLVGNINNEFPHITIVGGCCGSDFRHMRKILEQVQSESTI
jgi:homocysteine S-methyltransferase